MAFIVIKWIVAIFAGVACTVFCAALMELIP